MDCKNNIIKLFKFFGCICNFWFILIDFLIKLRYKFLILKVFVSLVILEC